MNRIYFILLFLISFFKLFSQDFILKADGKVILSKIDEIGTDIIKYHNYTNPGGESRSIKKHDVAKIYFDNGGVETLDNTVVNDSLLVSEIKNYIVENINKYGFVYRFPKQKFKASFEDEFFRIDFINKKTNEPVTGISYDFSTVYAFDEVSIRKDEKAYINIWISMRFNKKKNNWKKGKFVFGVNGHKNAHTIMGFMKFYSRLVLEETITINLENHLRLEFELNSQKTDDHPIRT